MAASRTPKKAKPKAQASQLHSMLKWLRSAGVGAELFGWGSLVLTDWFWPAVGFIYLGFTILATDLWLEPELRDNLRWRVVGVIIIAAICAAFSIGIVFVPAPFESDGFWDNGEYPDGTVVDGITWKPAFTELTVVLNNPTSRPYRDIDIVIRPTDPVAAIAQISKWPDVSFEDKNGLSSHLLDVDPTGVAKIIPLSLLATDAGYRVHCGKLPAHCALKLALALADLKWNPPLHPPPRDLVQAARAPDYVLRFKFDDFSTYWLGHPDGDVYAKNPSPPSWFKAEGQYYAAYRTRSISRRVNISNMAARAQPKN